QTGHTPIPPVLRSGSSRGHLTRSDRSDIASYGYGLRIEHVPGMGDVIGHSGGYPGYGSHMRWHRQSGLGIVALANGRYATPGIPASKALDVLVHEAMSRRRAAGKTVRPWPETLYAVRRITEALSSTGDAMRRGDDIGEACRTALSSITDVFAMNIELDADLESRARGLSEMLGILCGPPSARVAGMLSTLHADTPAQATWIIPCERHPLECSITLTPLSPPGIQTLDFRVADEPATDDVTETRLTSIIDLSEGDAICAATEETAAASAGRTAPNDTDTGIITGTKDGGE
uniref:serine hydrolase n=1 Tax=uncultured Bifidobacterium sp. TaxID=165187 RepID=UPI0028DB8ED2